MHVSARIENQQRQHSVTLSTDGREHSIEIPPKADGFGSSANGAELLLLSLATCYCNDIYREARKRNIAVRNVRVEAFAEFDTEGAAGHTFRYRATVDADASEDDILSLMHHTNTVAEIQNTLRSGSAVLLETCTANWLR